MLIIQTWASQQQLDSQQPVPRRTILREATSMSDSGFAVAARHIAAASRAITANHHRLASSCVEWNCQHMCELIHGRRSLALWMEATNGDEKVFRFVSHSGCDRG